MKKVCTIVLDADVRNNLKKIAIAQDTNFSALINKASSQYIYTNTFKVCRRYSWHSHVWIMCKHTSADYGPCISNPFFKHEHCRYRTSSEHYKINNKGTTEEEVFIDDDAKDSYQKKYSDWWYIENLREELRIWRPCEYYHQLNVALASTHAILNYSLFLALSSATYEGIPSRDLP